jgi:hypothetical protein
VIAPGLLPSHGYDCPTGQCGQDLTFPALNPDRAWVRVASAAGERTIEFASITYEAHRPNGPDCSPTCRQATLTVDIPA